MHSIEKNKRHQKVQSHLSEEITTSSYQVSKKTTAFHNKRINSRVHGTSCMQACVNFTNSIGGDGRRFTVSYIQVG